MCGALFAHFSVIRLRLGFSFSSDGVGDAYALFRATTAAFLETATYHHRASMVTKWVKELSMDQRKPYKVSQVVMFRTQCTSERVEGERKEKLAQHFPMWRREVKIMHTREGKHRQHAPLPSSPELHITPQHGARVNEIPWLSSTVKEFYPRSREGVQQTCKNTYVLNEL
jgi:hypothetical protein